MTKLRTPLPQRAMDHLVQRFKEGRIAASDFLELKHWVESNPDVPDGDWFKRFKTGILVGHGDTATSFLSPGMVAHGTEVN
jgi:hypothetical protein